jgi:hypothetical protein
MLTSGQLELTTLDEPVSETIKRDLRAIGIKLRYVFLPRISETEETMKELRNWDLWGPVCFSLFPPLKANVD